jgi:hypothetical protein
MIRNYDKKKNNIMSQLKRNEFLSKIKSNQDNDIYVDNPWRKFEKEIADLFEEN